jgi:putative sterol carrier protein
MSANEALQAVFNEIPNVFVPEKAAGVTATIQLNLDDDDGGDWYFVIADAQIKIEPGEAPNPELTLQMDTKDYIRLAKGEEDAMSLFMTGKIKVQGDIMLAMKFQELFDRSRLEGTDSG